MTDKIGSFILLREIFFRASGSNPRVRRNHGGLALRALRAFQLSFETERATLAEERRKARSRGGGGERAASVTEEDGFQNIRRVPFVTAARTKGRMNRSVGRKEKRIPCSEPIFTALASPSDNVTATRREDLCERVLS